MLELFIWITVFVFSLYVLSKSSDYFSDSAERVGLFLGFSPFIVGVTIVALGTSFPELISSILAVLRNSSEIVIGNVIGSNVTNIFLVLGIAVIVGKRMKIARELINVDLPLFASSAFLLILMIWDGEFTFFEGIISLLAFAVYLFYMIKTGKKHTAYKEVKKEELQIKRKEKKLNSRTIFVLIISLIIVFISASFTIESILKLSAILNIGKEIIAASAVALGTSLPELMVSISAARRGKSEIAVGNILGSNIFNCLIVMGIPALLGTLIIPQSIIFFGIPVLLAATFLYFFATQDKQITRWEGWMLIVFYVFYLGKLFNLF